MGSAEEIVVGVDIGGANLKLADSDGNCYCQSFPLWKYPDQLGTELCRLKAKFPTAGRWVVTMTGEMADCYVDRGEGVQRIVQQAGEGLGPDVTFYTVDGRFVDSREAGENDALVAASNWHAMASLVAQQQEGDGLLIDIGSTTTDLIPFANGRVTTSSRSDFDRLQRGELLYAGVGRTPICAVVDTLPYRQSLIPVMNECFASTDDCALLTGIAEEDPQDHNSCDGRPRTRAHATARMARMIGLDQRHVSLEDATGMALYIWERLQAQWMVAAEVLSTPAATWVLVGHGAQLLPIPADRRCIDLQLLLGADLSRVGPAYAIAKLASASPISSDTFS